MFKWVGVLCWLALAVAVDLEVPCSITCAEPVRSCYFQLIEERKCFLTRLCSVELTRCYPYIIEHVDGGEDPFTHCPVVTYTMDFEDTVCADCAVECEPAVYAYQCSDVPPLEHLCTVSCPVLSCPAPPIHDRQHKYRGWFIYGVVSITITVLVLVVLGLAATVYQQRKTKQNAALVKYVALRTES